MASLYETLREDVTGQARDQTQRAAGGLHGLAGELHQMAEDSSRPGMASGLVRQVAGQVDAAAGWLDGREPADLLDEVRRYARRSPGTFLAACAVVGFVGGRLTRGLRDEARDQEAPGPVHAQRQALAPAGTTAAPQPLLTEPGYGGRPSAVPPTIVAGDPLYGTAAETSGAAGTAAGNPLPGSGHLDDVYDDEDVLAGADPFADAPDLGQGGLGTAGSQEEGGDRR